MNLSCFDAAAMFALTTAQETNPPGGCASITFAYEAKQGFAIVKTKHIGFSISLVPTIARAPKKLCFDVSFLHVCAKNNVLVFYFLDDLVPDLAPGTFTRVHNSMQ